MHGDDRLRIAGSRGVVEVLGGRCRLISGGEAESGFTDSVEVRPIEQELLAALRGESQEFNSTQASLDMAETLLRARDAADEKHWSEFA